MIRCFDHHQLRVCVADATPEMADLAARDFAEQTRLLLNARDFLNVVFAGAQSQMAFHAALAARGDIDWPRINAFGVDEFWAPHIPVELTVCDQPRRDLYSRVPLRSVHILNHAAPDAESERARYDELIRLDPPDVACLGIGVSGHLAFNEPGQTDFADPRQVAVIDVCEASKRQLTGDPNFQALGRIPEKGITLTVPALMSAERVFCVVPYAIKADVVRRFFRTPVTTDLPASIIKQKPGARLYLDAESFSLSGDLGLLQNS